MMVGLKTQQINPAFPYSNRYTILITICYYYYYIIRGVLSPLDVQILRQDIINKDYLSNELNVLYKVHNFNHLFQV